MVVPQTPPSRSRPAEAPLGYFRNALLRLACGSPGAGRELRKLRTALRTALDEDRDSRIRTAAAFRVLDCAQALGIEAESAAHFRQEFLGQVVDSLDSPALSEVYAASELAKFGIDVVPRPWPFCSSLHSPSKRLTQLSTFPGALRRKTSSSAALVPVHVVETWWSGIERALNAVAHDQSRRWSEADCHAVLRMLLLFCLHGASSQQLPTADERRQFFEGIGLGLWRAVADRLERHMGTDAPSREEHAALQRQALSELRGLSTAQTLSLADDIDSEATSGPAPVGHVYVIRDPFPKASSGEDAETLASYAALRQPLPVARIPAQDGLESVVRAMSSEFPWATDAIAELSRTLHTQSLLGVQALRTNPILLVGPPGAGKSRFVRRLAENLKLPYLPLALGGNDDGRILLGTSRGWSSGAPSPLLGMMLQHRTASGLVLLDELDKATQGRSNAPSITSALLALLEPDTSSRWRDGFLQVSCDLSWLGFWATANALSSIPRPLLTRFSLVYMPEPSRIHMAALVQGIVRDIEREWGLPEGVLPLPHPQAYAHAQLNARELRRWILHHLHTWASEQRRRDRLH
jgi:hypothetical protein